MVFRRNIKKLLLQYYKDRFFQHLLKINLAYDNGDKFQVQYKKFKTYCNLDAIIETIKKGFPISIIVFKEGQICASYMEEKLQ